MNMQIKDVVLYGKGNNLRVLSFSLGKVNIITGESKTGKTALIDIVDYCLGASDCPISEGKIRENVEWFGIRLQFNDCQVFIARQNPSKLGLQSTGYLFLEYGDCINIPNKNKIINNSNVNALVSFLSEKLLISANLNTPPAGQTRDPLEANFKHSKLFCFQRQNYIDQPTLLFHKQAEPFIPQAIKDTLPYFLGAIREDQLKVEQELTIKKRELKRLEKLANEQKKIIDDGISRAFDLIEEARQLQLVDLNSVPKDLSDALSILYEVLKWEEVDDKSFTGDEALVKIQEELRLLEEELMQKVENAKAAEIFANEIQGFSNETSHQELRLESIRLFKDIEVASDKCPLCHNKLEVPVPTIFEMNKSIQDLKNNLETTERERPKLRNYINKIKEEIDSIKKQIIQRKSAIKSIYKTQEEIKKLKDLNVAKGKILGRISLFLESVDLSDKSSEHNKKIETLKAEIAELEILISDEEKEEKLNSILNTINVQMSKWEEGLDLEYKNLPIRFDIKKLTLIVDSNNGPIPLSKIGSGENWVAYHLLIHLALHKHFIINKRPVPSFLFLDQPTQAYYPPEKDDEYKGKIKISSDEEAVNNMFKLIFSAVKEMEGKMQVVITDHANLSMKDFQDSILEEWRDGIKLIPMEWYT